MSSTNPTTKPSPSPSDAKVLKIEPLPPSSAHWTSLHLTTYLDPLGHSRTWEHASRTTRPTTSPIDGVGIVAILQHPNPPNPSSTTTGDATKANKGPEIVLQKQFRPPLGKVVIEIPAGLVDEGESAADAALRELREETGYHGTLAPISSSASSTGGAEAGGLQAISPILFNDPGFCTTNLQMVHVDVDMSRAENQEGERKVELEENEFIEVFTCPLRDLYAECRRLEGEGFAIDARVGTLAEGIEVARRWGL